MDANMQEIFGGNGTEQVADMTNVGDSTKENEKKKKEQEMRDLMIAKLNTDPNFKEQLRSRSADIKVVKILGYSKLGNMVHDKEESARQNKRVLQNKVSANVGYRIQNVSKEPIQYQTESFTKDATGVFVGEKQVKTMAPGEVVDLTKANLTRLLSRGEFSFRVANGFMKPSSKTRIATLEDQLNAFYFSFESDEEGTKVQVNDDSVKLLIDNDGDIKPEFEAVFGYLNNPKVKKANSKKIGKNSDITSQDIFANYIRTLLENNGEL